MSFFGRSFVFDGIPSETYNLFISSPDGNDVDTPGGSDINIIKDEIRRRSEPFTYGVDQTSVLKFEIMVNTPDSLTAADIAIAKKWLLGRQSYKKLQIMQPDMQDVYFNCFFSNAREHKAGNILRGLKFDVECNAPWAFRFDKILTFDYTVPFVNTSISINNLSDDNYYLYPNLDITMNSTGGDLTITNTNDSDREFTFESMSPDEVLNVNNSLNMLTSSTDLFRLSNFNKQWFRLVPGMNNLTIVGNISQLLFTLKFAKKIGG